MKTETTSTLSPLIGLFRQDRADKSDDGVSVGKCFNTVGASVDFSVKPLLGPSDQICCLPSSRESGDSENVFPGVIKVVSNVGEFLAHVIQELILLGVNTRGVWQVSTSAASLSLPAT